MARSRSNTDSSSREPLSGRKLRERALDLLSRRDHSRLELKQKLCRKGAVYDELDELLADLARLGYLDDRRFAENFIRYRSGKAWGRRRYQQELTRRGVSAEVISEVLQSCSEICPRAQEEKLKRLVEREVKRGKPAEKVAASLARKGFSISSIRQVLGEMS